MKLKKRKGVALLLAIIFSLMFLIMAIVIAVVTLSNIRTTTEIRRGLKTFYSAEAGVFALAGYWIWWGVDAFVPRDIEKPCEGQANPDIGCYNIKRHGRIIREDSEFIKGYSSKWQGVAMFINSEAPPNKPSAEIEAIVSIPVKRGY
ncbi:pilus assembly PilX N-terminal domain-containing protein [bacterium]|nr:pilus assembly PilX N-terminal domain-containing protein [bacterium]MBU2461301.1 pilus assembly PilX N-terminal domain-containing protein [bacterium]